MTNKLYKATLKNNISINYHFKIVLKNWQNNQIPIMNYHIINDGIDNDNNLNIHSICVFERRQCAIRSVPKNKFYKKAFSKLTAILYYLSWMGYIAEKIMWKGIFNTCEMNYDLDKCAIYTRHVPVPTILFDFLLYYYIEHCSFIPFTQMIILHPTWWY